METYSGKIKRVKYRNDTNGWSVLEMKDGNTVVGSPAFASEDLEIVCEGEWDSAGKWGKQFKAKNIRIKSNGGDEKAALVALLGIGFLKGVKKVIAREIASRPHVYSDVQPCVAQAVARQSVRTCYKCGADLENAPAYQTGSGWYCTNHYYPPTDLGTS